MTNEDDRSVQERTDDYIRKYFEVKNGIKVEVQGSSNGKIETLKIEIPTERGNVQYEPEKEECKWKRVDIIDSPFYLLRRTTISGNVDLFLGKKGMKGKLPWYWKDLNRKEFAELKRVAKDLLKNDTKSVHKSRSILDTKLQLSTIQPDWTKRYVSRGGPVRGEDD